MHATRRLELEAGQSAWTEMIESLLTLWGLIPHAKQCQTNLECVRGVTVSELEKFLRKIGKLPSWVLMLAKEWWFLREEGESGEGLSKGYV